MTNPLERAPKMTNAAGASGALIQSARRARMIWENLFTAQPLAEGARDALAPQRRLALPVRP